METAKLNIMKYLKLYNITVSCNPIFTLFKVKKRDPLKPNLTADDITRIKELFPPDNYSPPSQEQRDMRCIRGQMFDSFPADTNTLRCISNFRVKRDGK